MLTDMPRYVVKSVVEKFVLKATLALMNAGCLVEAASGQLHKYNCRVDISKTLSLGKLSLICSGGQY